MCSLQKKLPNKQILILAVLLGCYLLLMLPFGISRFKIQVLLKLPCCQFSSALGGIISYVFLNTKPATNFWIGTTVALFGMAMLVGFNFLELDFDTAFLLAVLAGVYIRYIY
jgi:hypothetical protein